MKLLKANNTKIKIIIVDDSTMYRKVIKEFLENELGCEVISQASNGDEFLSLQNIHEADIILMDIQMPKLSGLEIAKLWTYKYPSSKIIAVTMYSEKVYLDQLVEVGFKGCILKSNFFEHIVPAIEYVMAGRIYFNRELQIK